MCSSAFHVHSVAKRARARKDDHKCLSSGPHIAECEIEESLKLILSVAEDLSNFSRGSWELERHLVSLPGIRPVLKQKISIKAPEIAEITGLPKPNILLPVVLDFGPSFLAPFLTNNPQSI